MGTDGHFSLQDNEQAYVSQLAASSTGCTPDVIANGIVTVNAVDNTTGLSTTASMPASYWCKLDQTTSYGGRCSGVSINPVRITYDQYGACTFVPNFSGTRGGTTTNPNGAYVVFDISEINNQSTQSFPFDPSKLYVQQDNRDFTNASLEIYRLFSTPALSTTFPAGEDAPFNFAEQVAVAVTTAEADGGIGANNHAYSLYYDRQASDPPVNMFKTNASQQSWPVPETCCDMGLATCQ